MPGVSLSDLDVLVVDCQSTGASPKHGALLEIGWAAARAGAREAAVTAQLVALPEGARIPRAVSRITGLREADLAGAISAAAAWQGVRQAAAGLGAPAPTVIHYARFEVSWLAHLRDRFEPGADLPFDAVCTHEIARRLQPGLPRRGLRALAGYYGFDPSLLRRSDGHVAATVWVWHHQVHELAERGVDSWPALKAWLGGKAPSSRKRVYPLARDKRLSLPDRPGIYQLLRSSGDILYVGKATSLKRRVNSYFTKQTTRHERMLEMLSQTRDLRVVETETALEAALLESDVIKLHRPPYNVQLRDEERDVWFATRDLGDAATAPDARCSLGPLPSRWSLASLSALCTTLADAGGGARTLARAVGAPPGFGPDGEVFAAGLSLFRRRYFGPDAVVVDALRALLALSKRLNRMLLAGLLSLDGDDDGDRSWDPPRVARHLTRVVLQSGVLVRRSRWLCLLSDAAVCFREADHSERRLLLIEGGEIVARSQLAAGAPLPAPPGAGRDMVERRRHFDIGRYDRLRVLSTELKRVMAQTGVVAVRPNHKSLLCGQPLAAVLDGV